MRRVVLLVMFVLCLLPARPATASVNSQGQFHALRELSSSAADIATYRRGYVGVAVYRLDSDDSYEFQGNRSFYMYSTVKVPIMLAVLDRVVRENRHVTWREQYLIESMIQYSDNDAATALIISIGGAPAVQDFLTRNRIYNTYIDPMAWGASTTTASDMARLLARLGTCSMLVQRLCNYAMQVMRNVDASQAWGVSAGVGNATVALKNGWYPDTDGWGVHSVGIVNSGGKNYAIAVLTYPNPSFDYGISTVEQISSVTYQAMK